MSITEMYFFVDPNKWFLRGPYTKAALTHELAACDANHTDNELDIIMVRSDGNMGCHNVAVHHTSKPVLNYIVTDYTKRSESRQHV